MALLLRMRSKSDKEAKRALRHAIVGSSLGDVRYRLGPKIR
jgi:hypothetical protein